MYTMQVGDARLRQMGVTDYIIFPLFTSEQTAVHCKFK